MEIFKEFTIEAAHWLPNLTHIKREMRPG